MRKITIILIVLSLIAAFVICGKTFTQNNTDDSTKSVKASEPTEATEATIPYSDAYNSPDTGADSVEVVEDTE